jgi:imidazolonepropionase-like amidohydrolase
VRPRLLTNARVVDVLTGGIREGAAIVLRDGLIESVVDATATVPPDAEIVDVAGRYVVPGIVTVHTHLSILFPFSDTDENEDPALTAFRAAARAAAALHAGATTIRCIHEQHGIDLRLREASARGWFTAPRILAGGRALSTPGGHGRGTGSVYCSGPEQFYAAAMAELGAGADHVKIFITGGLAHDGERPQDAEMTAAEMAAVVRAADRHGSYVVAHVGHQLAIQQALQAGVTSFEHAYQLDEETARLLAVPGVYVSPTLIVTHSQSTMRAKGFEEHSMANARRAALAHLASIRRLVAAGVTLTHGTDYPPGDITEGTSAVVAEATLMQHAGLTPLQTLQAATVNGARLCRISDRTGAVAPGLAADLLVIDDDPTVDVAALGGLRMVMAAGAVVRNDLGPMQMGRNRGG